MTHKKKLQGTPFLRRKYSNKRWNALPYSAWNSMVQAMTAVYFVVLVYSKTSYKWVIRIHVMIHNITNIVRRCQKRLYNTMQRKTVCILAGNLRLKRVMFHYLRHSVHIVVNEKLICLSRESFCYHTPLETMIYGPMTYFHFPVLM